MYAEDVGAILKRWQVHEHWGETAFADLFWGKLAHVVGRCDDEHAGMRFG